MEDGGREMKGGDEERSGCRCGMKERDFFEHILKRRLRVVTSVKVN